MTTYTQEQRLERFDTLPPELREAILSVESIEKLKRLGKKHGLMLDQSSAVSDEIGLTMLGFTKTKDFVNHLVQRLNISQEKAVAISEDINTDFFAPIRKHLVDNESKYEDSTPVADEHLQPHEHEAVRQETLAAIESHPPEQHVSVNVLSKTQPIMAQQKPIEQGTPTTPVASATPAPVTPEVPTTTISQPTPATNPELVVSMPITQATPVEPPKPAPKAPSYLVDPYREPIE